MLFADGLTNSARYPVIEADDATKLAERIDI
jgi:hypothetical protein